VFDIPDNIFREYDIRGTWGKDLTTDVAELIGRAYAIYLAGRVPAKGRGLKASVGRDVRESSRPLRDALIRGLTSSGIGCVDIGVAPTPLQYYSLHTLDVDGGVMITGSHNPPEYNGFKISVGKETIHGAAIQALKKVIKEDVLGKPASGAALGAVEPLDIAPTYMDHVAGDIRLERTGPVKLVIDAGNGTAGPVAAPLLRRLGCEVVELYCEPDGRFPNHHPDPTVPENLEALIAAVKRERADLGVAYDGDADRIGVVDERGGIIWGDKLMVIFSGAILRERPGATIVGEVKCSQVMYDEIERMGGKAVMWKTGHSLIKARMKELGAAMAGEMSGHIFFADRYFGFDDALYASCRLVEILSRLRAADRNATISGLLSGLPRTHVTPEIRVDCPDDAKFKVIEDLDRAVGEGGAGIRVTDVIRIDGLRINFDGGWALVRASNTQPVLVLRFEATGRDVLEKAIGFIKGRLDAVRPGLGAAV
jgi:phosphomannomutase/phosphoglucomutase